MAYRVLIIDDDVDFIESGKVLLENNGYEVITAFDGQEGVRKALEERPDIILLDVLMTTEDDGFQITHRIKLQAPVPIVILTSLKKGSEKSKVGVKRVPLEEYIEKPINPERLISAIKNILGNEGQ